MIFTGNNCSLYHAADIKEELFFLIPSRIHEINQLSGVPYFAIYAKIEQARIGWKCDDF